MQTIDKLQMLRNLMAESEIDAYIVLTSDPHISEYLPDYWKTRMWISGFTGSAGTFAITKEKAALWTDSRYFLQAEKELAGSTIELCKLGLPETPSLEAWLVSQLKKGDKVGFDGKAFQVTTTNSLVAFLGKKGIECDYSTDLISPIWEDRPELPKGKAFIQELKHTGKSVSEKIEEIRKSMQSKGATAYLMCALDEVCWTFNLRGSDVDYNPVVLCYGYIDQKKATIFIDFDKIDEKLANTLYEQGIRIKPYQKIEKQLKKLFDSDVVLIDPARTNYYLYSKISKAVVKIEATGIVTELKSRKNSIELEGFRQAMIEDGVALIEFFHWFEENLGKTKMSEMVVCSKLKEFRAKRPMFVSESFHPIVGYKEHGAIVHYSPSNESDCEIKADGFLLIDSGGQYLSGTTDITRTIHLGKPTEEEKVDYTLVLKGMIQLAMIKFPSGTRGSQLDTFARMAMWKMNINYGHGTGHGVGSFLNVHEGPMQIRPDNHLPIELGVVMSDEPGLYRAGKWGIRTENLIACVADIENEFGKFQKFETLTLCPIDTKPVLVEMLLPEEREWLNSYHSQVYEKLSPLLNSEQKDWLKEKTKKI